MIIGIGTDIVKVKRIEQVIKRTPSFLTKAFTENEIKYFNKRTNNYESIAGGFAAKEAVSKALNTGFRGFNPKDIEVIHDKNGKPSVELSDKIIEKFNLGKHIVHVTISHTDEDAIAFVIIEEVM